MDENRIGRKQDWTKSFGPKQVGQKQGGRKLGARYGIYQKSIEYRHIFLVVSIIIILPA